MAFFTIAVNSGFGDKTHVDYVDATIFGKRAEGGLIQYLNKGQQVLVTGNVILESREHEGKTYTSMKLNVSELDLVGGKKDNQGQGQQQQQQNNAPQGGAPAQSGAAPQAGNFEDFEDDIPF